MLMLLLACALGEGGPATPGSASAEAVAAEARIATQAGEIESMAIELEEVATSARTIQDPAQRAAAIADVQTRIEAIRAKNQALQAELLELDRRLHDQAGDPALPAPPTER